jgi:hypothetical protein
LIANGVPSKRNGSGKKSATEGGWKPPSPLEAANSRIVAAMDRANSSRAGVTTPAALTGPCARDYPES